MKFKSKQTIIFSIITFIFLVIGIGAVLLFKGLLPPFQNPVVESEKIVVTNVDGNTFVSGKIKNQSKEPIILKDNCLSITIWSKDWGEVHILLTIDDPIVLQVNEEFDLSSSRIYVDTIIILSADKIFYKGDKFDLGDDYYIYHIDGYDYNIYDKSYDKYANISAIVSAILTTVFALIALAPVIIYLRIKRRYDLAQSALAQIDGGIYLRGAICKKNSSIIKPTLLSKIKDGFNALTMEVKITTNYSSAKVTDFIITEQGLYIAQPKSKTIDVNDMEFFDKEKLGKTQIYAHKSNVVLNQLSGDDYYVFDVRQTTLTTNKLTETLEKMLDEDVEIQHVEFDQDSAQKNI